MPRLSKIGAAALAAFGWTGLSSVTADYLVVAGGGGGGSLIAGGGGGGGFRTSAGTSGGGASAEAKLSLNPTLSYSVTVGAGGAGASGSTVKGTSGSNSIISSVTSTGGGGGGSADAVDQNGLSGGSGGGGSTTVGSGGAGTSGQGYAGGAGGGDLITYTAGGGGGGAGAVGANASLLSTPKNAGNGGTGVASSITGSSVTYAGGGGGSINNSYTAGTGGAGGGGNGANTNATSGTAGTANLGGGGGAGGFTGGAGGGSGGSGVVIISYPSPQKFGGGIVTTSGGNTIHTFQTSGTLSPLSTLTANFLVVAGGGAGGAFGGAGGGGGLRTSAGTSGGGASAESSLTIDTNSIYLVTVGAGGTGAASRSVRGTNGSNSAFLSVSSVGGGAGGSDNSNSYVSSINDGANGGSGGGSSYASPFVAGTGTANQGFAGAIGGVSTNLYGGSGGGAGSVGGAFTGGGAAGTGGSGVSSSISGASVGYAGGGGGSSSSASGGGTASSGGGAGGLGVGGTAGTSGLGGGGGGSWAGTGVNGGSGIVIISYAGSTQLMAGGTVTITGGNVIHTFNSSGYLTPIDLVGNSLRFRGSSFLSRTPRVASNRKTWTWSGWVKLSSLPATTPLFAAYIGSGTTDNDYFALFYVGTTGSLSTSGYSTTYLTSSALYRDFAAWYHVVCVVDTTSSTANNRIRLYVNGVELTSFSTRNNPSQNADLGINQAALHEIGQNGGFGVYFNGYMTEIQFIDGQALTPNSFGTFNSFGVWQPINYGGSYGTNGFYLPFTNTTNTTTLGLDFSPQGNNWTANNFSLARSSYTSYTSSSGTYTVPAGVTSLSYLVVAGGGGGGSGGGGAGGLLQGTMAVTGGQTIAYSIGAGGTGGNYNSSIAATNGTNTTFGALTAIGGGAGTFAGSNGTAGGSGSGGSGSGSGTTTGGAGTSSQGNAGGGNAGNIASPYPSGGGGGAGAVGSNAASSSTSGAGGAGITWVNGTTYAGGGGGGTFSAGNPAGAGGAGGGGAGGSSGNGTAGTANTGGGGGGSPSAYVGGAGGSGIIIIGTGSASTYDSMTDVPTLTSTTAANYCVLNPLNQFSGDIISNGNLTWTANSLATSTNRTTVGMTTGKWYCEYTVGAISTSATIGIVNASAPNNNYVGNDTNGYGYWGYTTSYSMHNGSTTAYGGGAWSAGDVMQIYFDADAGTIGFRRNGTDYGNAFTGIPAGTWFFAIGHNGYAGDTGSFNFGQQPFVYTPPTGFIALNTFNL